MSKNPGLHLINGERQRPWAFQQYGAHDVILLRAWVSHESHEFQHETLTKESISQVPPDGVHEVYDSDSETNFEARDDFLLQHHEGSP
jgi:hypothetical protein